MRNMNSCQNSCRNNMQNCNRGCGSNYSNSGCNMERDNRSNSGCGREGNSRSSCGCNMERGNRNNGSRSNCDCDKDCRDHDSCLGKQPLAMAYVPIQAWEHISDSCTGLRNATIFEDLVLPTINTNCPTNCGRRGY